MQTRIATQVVFLSPGAQEKGPRLAFMAVYLVECSMPPCTLLISPSSWRAMRAKQEVLEHLSPVIRRARCL